MLHIAYEPTYTSIEICRLLPRLDGGQGERGLGLAAQRMAVQGYLATQEGAELVAEFTEIESGKKKNRPELAEALKLCKRQKATLIIAKLDRLARNVHFISGLMESRGDFQACDNPYANRLMVHMLAAVAEHEREMISQRTKEGLRAAKPLKFGKGHAIRVIAAWLTRDYRHRQRPV